MISIGESLTRPIMHNSADHQGHAGKSLNALSDVARSARSGKRVIVPEGTEMRSMSRVETLLAPCLWPCQEKS